MASLLGLPELDRGSCFFTQAFSHPALPKDRHPRWKLRLAGSVPSLPGLLKNSDPQKAETTLDAEVFCKWKTRSGKPGTSVQSPAPARRVSVRPSMPHSPDPTAQTQKPTEAQRDEPTRSR